MRLLQSNIAGRVKDNRIAGSQTQAGAKGKEDA
jgi:hypothetical protein